MNFQHLHPPFFAFLAEACSSSSNTRCLTKLAASCLTLACSLVTSSDMESMSDCSSKCCLRVTQRICILLLQLAGKLQSLDADLSVDVCGHLQQSLLETLREMLQLWLIFTVLIQWLQGSKRSFSYIRYFVVQRPSDEFQVFIFQKVFGVLIYPRSKCLDASHTYLWDGVSVSSEEHAVQLEDRTVVPTLRKAHP